MAPVPQWPTFLWVGPILDHIKTGAPIGVELPERRRDHHRHFLRVPACTGASLRMQCAENPDVMAVLRSLHRRIYVASSRPTPERFFAGRHIFANTTYRTKCGRPHLVRELRTLGSMRGASGNRFPYRDPRPVSDRQHATPNGRDPQPLSVVKRYQRRLSRNSRLSCLSTERLPFSGSGKA